MIYFKCTSCGARMEADNFSGGKQARCVKCNNIVDIPYPEKLPTLQCPNCEEAVDLDSSWAGKIANCPKCGSAIRVPELEGQASGTGCFGLVSILILFAGAAGVSAYLGW